MKTIQSGQTLTARSVCDHDCVFSVTVIERKGSFATVKTMGQVKRVKVQTDHEGNECVYAHGRFSMAPIFRAP